MVHIADVAKSIFPNQNILVHTNAEPEFSLMRDDELIVEIVNPREDFENLYLFKKRNTFTLVYADWSCHYPMNDEGAEHLLQVAASILDGESSVLRVEWDDDFLDVLIYRNRVLFSDDASREVNWLLANKRLQKAIYEDTAKLTRIHWN